MTTGNGHVSFIWGFAELLRGDFKQSDYGQVVLPFVLLRRLDQVLAPTKEKVLEEAVRLEGRGLDLDPILKRAAGQRFYNASRHDLERVHSDAENALAHLQEYLAGFDPAVREIFEAFDFEATLTRLQKAGLLYRVLGRILDPELDLHPDRVPNAAMGDLFEELIRRFSEISNETAGEHFTPREVVRLCAELVLAGDEALDTPGIVRTVYDPACGTGGMLSMTDELVRDRNPQANMILFGQELNPESWAICRAEMLLKGQDPSHIAPGSTLSADGAAGQRFDYMLANPPFGVDWSKDHDAVKSEHEQDGAEGRFAAGLPRKSDGALLFLQNMIAKMKPADQDGGSRIAIIFNASPLFSGGAGSGESEIRRCILENDWLEAIVALPEQLFYNTGISTYIWVVSDQKAERRRGKVQLIDARELWEQMPKSLGNKRRRLSAEHIEEVLDLWRGFEEDSEQSKVRDNDFFGYRRIVVERPLRLRYRAGEEAVARLTEQSAFQKLIEPAKVAMNPDAEREAGERVQQALIDGLRSLNGLNTTDRTEAEKTLKPVFADAGKLSAAVRKAVWEAVSERDAEAPVVTGKKGEPEPDPALRDEERIPLGENVEDYLTREVTAFVSEAWVDASKSKIGYEIPLTRLFYRYAPPRPVEEIDAEIHRLEAEIVALVGDVTT